MNQEQIAQQEVRPPEVKMNKSKRQLIYQQHTHASLLGVACFPF
jgi:hypothetical protein